MRADRVSAIELSRAVVPRPQVVEHGLGVAVLASIEDGRGIHLARTTGLPFSGSTPCRRHHDWKRSSRREGEFRNRTLVPKRTVISRYMRFIRTTPRTSSAASTTIKTAATTTTTMALAPRTRRTAQTGTSSPPNPMRRADETANSAARSPTRGDHVAMNCAFAALRFGITGMALTAQAQAWWRSIRRCQS